MKKWIEVNWIWVAIIGLDIIGIIVTPENSWSMVPYALILLSTIFYGALKFWGGKK